MSDDISKLAMQQRLDPQRDPRRPQEPAQRPTMFVQPLPAVKVEEPLYYTCTMLHHNMHRTDGSILRFHFGVLKTYLWYDIDYLENEIAHGNNMLRRSTESEINIYNMRVDPKGTIASELRPAIEAEMKLKLEQQLEAGLIERAKKIGVIFTEEQLSQMADVKRQAEEEENRPPPASGELTPEQMAARLSQVDALRQQTGIKTGTGVLFPAPGGAQLKGIAGTDKMAQAAGDSNSI